VTLIFGASYAAGAADFDDVYSGMNLDIDGLTGIDPTTTPEPPTWMLMALAMGIIVCIRMKNARSQR
jgi:hypothetical protein